MCWLTPPLNTEELHRYMRGEAKGTCPLAEEDLQKWALAPSTHIGGRMAHRRTYGAKVLVTNLLYIYPKY